MTNVLAAILQAALLSAIIGVMVLVGLAGLIYRALRATDIRYL